MIAKMKILIVTLSVLVCFSVQVNCDSDGKIFLFLKFSTAFWRYNKTY